MLIPIFFYHLFVLVGGAVVVYSILSGSTIGFYVGVTVLLIGVGMQLAVLRWSLAQIPTGPTPSGGGSLLGGAVRKVSPEGRWLCPACGWRGDGGAGHCPRCGKFLVGLPPSPIPAVSV
jgi:hypothetical protein